MARKKQKSTIKTEQNYFLKLVVFLMLGFFWLRIGQAGVWQISLPIGFVIGLYLAWQEKLKIDRKIEYAILLVAMLIGFWAPQGLFINV